MIKGVSTRPSSPVARARWQRPFPNSQLPTRYSAIIGALMRRGAGDVYRFGPFELDSSRRRLVREGEPVSVPARHLDILILLASNAGRVVSKDALIEAGWKDVAVSDNSIEQAISSLRRTLGNQADGAAYIETPARRGYRFPAEVERGAARHSDAAPDALPAPH